MCVRLCMRAFLRVCACARTRVEERKHVLALFEGVSVSMSAQRAILSMYRALLSIYMAVLSVYRALLSEYRAL